MSNKRYHINPETGVPSICRAVAGNCPYGGESGSDNHFNTYSEAQKQSQEIFEDTYRLLPSSIVQDPQKIMSQIEERRKVKLTTLDKLPRGGKGSDDYEITKAIINTNDENIVMGVIEGEIYQESGWRYASVALQNPNISKKFLNEALFDYPGEFDKTTRRWLTLNRSLTHDELVTLIEDEDEDMEVRAVAFRNVNLDKDYVSNIIDNDTDSLNSLPHAMILYSHNRDDKCQEVENEVLIFGTRKNLGVSEASGIAVDYRPWSNLYRDRIGDDK